MAILSSKNCLCWVLSTGQKMLVVKNTNVVAPAAATISVAANVVISRNTNELQRRYKRDNANDG